MKLLAGNDFKEKNKNKMNDVGVYSENQGLFVTLFKIFLCYFFSSILNSTGSILNCTGSVCSPYFATPKRVTRRRLHKKGNYIYRPLN